MTAQYDRLGRPGAGARFDAGVREAVPMPIEGSVGPDDVAEASRLGPESLTWKFYGDHRTQFFGFQRVAGVENCIEQLGQGVLDHSVIFSDTLGRTIPAPPMATSSSNTDTSTCPAPPQVALPVAFAVMWTVPGPNGVNSNYKFCYASLTINRPPVNPTI